MIPSYQKIQQIYNKEVQDIKTKNIIVEEKVDGSQFRIKVNRFSLDCGSHHQELSLVDSMFKLATDKAQEIFWPLVSGLKSSESDDEYTIFCEYLKSPKHNTLVYNRVPKNHLVIFDVLVNGKYMDRMSKELFAKAYDVEIVPMLYRGNGEYLSDENVKTMLDTESFLGKAKIEGIVIKAYDSFYDVNLYPYLQGHFMCTKIVRPEFKEMNKAENLSKKNELESLKESVRTDARWNKAIQKCKEQNIYTGKMQDLKFIVPEVQRDLEEEEKENIKDALWNIYGKDIIRASIVGLPEYYGKSLGEQT